MSGGLGDDTFFLDGRDGDVTCSTITDFQAIPSISRVGFKGVTFHYNLDGR